MPTHVGPSACRYAQPPDWIPDRELHPGHPVSFRAAPASTGPFFSVRSTVCYASALRTRSMTMPLSTSRGVV
jgi:hypothetical protein